MRGSHKNRLRKNVQTRAGSRPVLEALEQRLQLGDTVLGGLLARSLFGNSAPLVGFGGAVAEQWTHPSLSVALEHASIAAARAAVPDVSVRSEHAETAQLVAATSVKPDDGALSAEVADPLNPLNLLPSESATAGRWRPASADALQTHSLSGASGPTPGLEPTSSPVPSEPPLVGTEATNAHVPIVHSGNEIDSAVAAAVAANQGAPVTSAPSATSSGALPSAAAPAATARPHPAPFAPLPRNGGGQDFGFGIDCQMTPVGGAAMLVPSETPSGATSSFTLVNGASYTLEAAGDVQVSDVPQVRGDAQWQDFARPRNVSSDGTSQVGLKVVGAGVAGSHPIWGNSRADHIYRLQVTGQGTPIRIYYNDSPSSYGGHHGVFGVRVLGHGSGSGPQDAICPGGVAARTCKDCDCSGGSAPTPAGTGTGGPGDHWRVSNQAPGSSDSMGDQAPGSCTGPSNADMSSAGGIRYFDGGVEQSMRDLVSGGFSHIFGFSHSWSNLGIYGNATSSIGPGGSVSQQPYLQNPRGDSSVIGVMTALGGTADWFQLNAQGLYVPVFYEEDMLFHDPSSHLFTFVDALGNSLSFFDFDVSWPTNMQGQLTLAYDPYGADPVGQQFHKTQVIRDAMTGAVTEIVRTDPNASAPLSESYLYSYQGGNLRKVIQRRGADSSSYQTVRVLVLTYYPGGTSGGNAGNLESATVCNSDDATLPCAAGNANALDTSYYRYFVTGESGGFPGSLKMVVGPQSFARLRITVNPLYPNNPSDGQISPFADYQYTYFTDMDPNNPRKAKSVIVQGAGCSACTGGQGLFSYTYTASGATTLGANIWAMKTVEKLPDNVDNVFVSQNTIYTNEAAEPMVRIYESGPAGSTQKWISAYIYDQDGRIAKKVYPSAISCVHDSFADLLDQTAMGDYGCVNDNTGLIEVRQYGSPSDMAPGYYKGTLLQQGKASQAVWQRRVTYTTVSADPRNGGQTVHPMVTSTVFRGTITADDPTGACAQDPTGTLCEKTNYSSVFWSNQTGATVRLQSVTVTKPVVQTSQNGPGAADVADVETHFFDPFGREIWSKDPDGFITYTAYDQGTGAVVKRIQNVDYSRLSTTEQASFNLTGWAQPMGGLHLVTQLVVDNLGRTTQLTDPNGNNTYIVYKDTNYEARVYRGWNPVTNMPTGPTRSYREDRGHSGGDTSNYPTYTDVLTMSVPPHLTSNLPDGTEAPAGIQSLTRSYTSKGGQVYRVDNYFNLPDMPYASFSGLYAGTAGAVNADGSVSGNYWMTQYAYDKRGRQKSVTLPTGTIYRTVYDGLSRLSCNWVGTNDMDFNDDSGCNQTPANMIKTSVLTYDLGLVGDSNLTSRIDYPSGSAVTTDQRETDTLYDWRDRPVLTKQGVQATEDTVTHRPIFYTDHDNLNEVTSSERYDGDQQYLTNWPYTGGVPNRPSAGLLRAKTTPQYDNQMRVFESNVFSVDQSSGVPSFNSLKTDYWFDHRGNQIKMAAPGGLVTKTAYDAVSRPITVYTSDGQESGQTGTSWQKAFTIAGDTVLTQTENQYDNNGNVIRLRRRDRFHDATALGALRTPNLAPKARVSYLASYYDPADRLTDQIDVGTVGGLTSGQATGGSTFTLTDTIQSWQTNQWAGLAVEIIAGTGANQVRTIASNTNNQLTVTSGWDTAPDATSLYAVAYVRPAAVPARSDTVLISSYGYKADAVTRVALTATGGTFKLIYNGTPTAAISYNAAATDVQSALQAVVGTNNVLVSGPAGGVGVPGGPWLVRFAGSLAEMKVSDLTGDGSGLTGGTLSVVPQSQGGDGGRAQKMTDPRALISKTDYDAMGRTLRTTDDFVGFVPTDGSDRQTEFTYDGSSHIITRTAKLSNTSVETTQYTYNVTRDSSCSTNANSCVNSNDLLASIHYPGDSAMINETYAYNALGQTKTKTDRNQSTHQYTFDVLGRQTKDAVTTLGTGVDNRVLALATAYDTGGRAYLFTSYNSATGTDPVNNQVNQVQRTFNGLYQLTGETQTHGNSQATAYTISYAYSFVGTAGGPNHSRLTSITYPNGRIVRYEYNSGLDASISRLSFLADDNGGAIGTHLEEYSYLGLNTVIKRAHPEPGVDLTYLVQSGDFGCAPACDAGDQYTGLDRFGRVIDQRWIPTSLPQNPIDRFKYTYDRDSNRLARTNAVNTLFNESYGYDSFNQLTSFSRNTHSEGWGLDNVGNWKTFTNDQTGPPSHTRMHNVQNQITSIDSGLVTPTYDANGNTTRDERGKLYTYDGWNRLASGGGVTFSYDALNRRIVENPGTATDLYYSKDWQVLEERQGASVVAQNVWSPVYVDAMVLRDGSQRLYVQQDANWNVTGIVGNSGGWMVLERYVYDPYGKATVLDPVSWAVRHGDVTQYGTSNFSWVYLHQGGRYTRFDDLSGLYYFRNRDLSPTLGRWMQEDPYSYVDGANIYSYVVNNPVNVRDSQGTSVEIFQRGVDPGGGGTICNLKGKKPITVNNNEGCSRICTAHHEQIHYRDLENPDHPLGKCCQKARKAYEDAGSQAARDFVAMQYNNWVARNIDLIECEAYKAGVACAEAAWAAQKCDKCPDTEPPGSDKDKENWKAQKKCCDDLSDYKKDQIKKRDSYCKGIEKQQWGRCPF